MSGKTHIPGDGCLHGWCPRPGALWAEEAPFEEDLRWREGGHIIIHETARRLVPWAHRRLLRVVRVGSAVTEVREGDFVLSHEFAGVEFELEGRRLYAMWEGEVWAVVETSEKYPRVF